MNDGADLSPVVVRLVGWTPGAKTITLIQLIREYSTIRNLAECKAGVDRLLEGQVVDVTMAHPSNAEPFRRAAASLGAKVE